MNNRDEKRLNEQANLKGQKRFAVILVRPKNPENIGLVARCMKNTGFEDLRLVLREALSPKSFKTAVRAHDILERARIFQDLAKATYDLNLILAASSKVRKNFTSLSLDEAVYLMLELPQAAKIGLLFGNERTGLTSEELRSSNFRFKIPQAIKQPSYNLASAVLVTLFQIYNSGYKVVGLKQDLPLLRNKQEECIELILKKLEKKKFIHSTNRLHVTEMVYDLFGRLALTAKDKKLLLALFSKGAD
jgi:tRNA/rRNA methyltransferase